MKKESGWPPSRGKGLRSKPRGLAAGPAVKKQKSSGAETAGDVKRMLVETMTDIRARRMIPSSEAHPWLSGHGAAARL